MLIKNRTIIEVEVKGREYRFECAGEASLDEAELAVDQVKAYIVERKKQVSEQAQSATEEVVPVEENAGN